MFSRNLPRNLTSISKLFLGQNFARMASSYETLNVTTPQAFVYHVELNRPTKMNAMNHKMWLEIGECFQTLETDENCRVIVLSGAGKIFCAGIDLMDAANNGNDVPEGADCVRRAKVLKKFISTYQRSLSSLEISNKPVLAAVHSGCIGGAVDLITAADIRYCTQDAWFQVKEVDVGMAADVGTLQRLPKIIGSTSLVRELCFTARKLPADEAATCGLVSKTFPNKETMMKEVLSVAGLIASKSPVAVQGTKASLNYSRDHTVQEGLDHICQWNQLAMQSDDFAEAVVAAATKNKDIVFSKL